MDENTVEYVEESKFANVKPALIIGAAVVGVATATALVVNRFRNRNTITIVEPEAVIIEDPTPKKTTK